MLMFMVLSSRSKPFQEFSQFIWQMQTENRLATNLQTKPANLGSESAKSNVSQLGTFLR